MSDQVQALSKSAIIPVGERGIELKTVGDIWQFANFVLRSSLAPKDMKNPETVVLAIQTGLELGISPMQALQSIAVINGRPCIWGDLMIALCRSHPQWCEQHYQERIDGTGDSMKAVCSVGRTDGQPHTVEFSVADAKAAGLWGVNIWAKYPKRMLQMRARSWALRDVFPDILKGVSSAEEIRDIKQIDSCEIRRPQSVDEPSEPPQDQETQDIQGKFINGSDMRKMFAVARANGLHEDQLREYTTSLGIEHLNEIPREDFGGIIQWIESHADVQPEKS